MKPTEGRTGASELCGKEDKPLAKATRSIIGPTPAELAAGRLAEDNAVGTLCVSGMELEPAELEIANRFARDETDLAAIRAQMDTLIETDL